MQTYVQAIGIGFLLSMIPGPIFFSLLETSITKGIRAALSFNLGVLLSDLLYIVCALLFFWELSSLAQGDHKLLFRFITGIIFIGFGFVNFFKKVEIMSKKGNEIIIHVRHYLLLSLKGFVLNLANPLIVFYWLSVVTLAQTLTDSSSEFELYSFLGLIIITFMIIDLIKIVLAKSLRPLVTNILLKRINQLVGIVFVIIGSFLIFQFLVRIM
ncbi:MAG: LysE family transporter [Bacteroidetes bacterium]|nr:LysE family transporter [Bacteroidota bacterium]